MRLGEPPRLASWNASTDREQVALARYLAGVWALAEPRANEVDGPLSLRLDVSLPETIALLDHHDLDNYAFPLASHLTRVSGRHVWSVFQDARHQLVPHDR